MARTAIHIDGSNKAGLEAMARAIESVIQAATAAHVSDKNMGRALDLLAHASRAAPSPTHIQNCSFSTGSTPPPIPPDRPVFDGPVFGKETNA